MAYPGSTYDVSAEAGATSLIAETPDRPKIWNVPKKETPMYRYQNTLPRLPIPTLEHTCFKYLRSVRPLLTDKEFGETSSHVTRFLLDGTGEELQKRLLDRASSKDDSSWLIDWWNGLSYFGYRDPVVFYVSYFYQFKDEVNAADQRQCFRAAKFIKASMKYRELIISEQLEPEISGREPQDMSMYKFLFNACRMPQIPTDSYITYDGTFYHHVIAIRKNKFYKVDIVVNGWELSTAQIEEQLQKVIGMAGTAAADAVGSLTSGSVDKNFL